MVAIDLQLVGLAVVMTIDHVSSVVKIFGVRMLRMLYGELGCVLFLLLLFNKLGDFSNQLLVLLVEEVILVVDTKMESPGVLGVFNC